MSYCTIEELDSMFGDISDNPAQDLFLTAIDNSETWINANLKKNFVPIPTKTPDTLRTVAIYYAASDILLTLYHGDELPVQYDVWFNKAQSLLQDYIDAYNNADADSSDLVARQFVKHSKARTYNQKRGRRNIWGR